MRRSRAALVCAVTLGAGAAFVGGGGVASGQDAATTAAGGLSGGFPGRAAGSVAEAERAAATLAGAPAGQTVSVVARPARGQEVDLPPTGPSPGDAFVFEDVVFDRSDTRRVGSDSVRCEIRVRTFACDGTIIVNGSKIQVTGAFVSNSDVTMPVTGGTGAYAGVGGEMTIFDLPRNRAALVFHLVR